MMDSREAILRAVREGLPPRTEYPTCDDGYWIHYEDRLQQFANMLTEVGGRCILANGMDELNTHLRQLTSYTSAKKICSCVVGAGKSNVNLDEIQTPHDLADVDFAILPGQFGVAENGAVWLLDAHLKHRVICFIPRHVALVIRTAGDPEDAVVDTMHDAYQRIAINESSFGVFISGPSKTADIEQALVIGAHGPRSLTVFLLHEPEPPVPHH